jgi:hypothetical protein
MALAAALAADPGRMPALRTEAAARLGVSRDVSPRNEAGVPLDADLRELLATTIEDCNALPLADASALEESRAAKSLAAPAARAGITAMLRGKPPEFPRPLA